MSQKQTTKEEQEASCTEWGERKELIEFIMLENSCSYTKAIVILEDFRQRMKDRK